MYSYRPKAPKWSGELRKCVVCGLEDAPLFVGEFDSERNPIFDHKVVIDLVFIDHKKLTQKEREEGYDYLAMGEGTLKPRHCKVRQICRPCLEAYEETRRVWQDFDAQRKRDSDDVQPNYYHMICNE